MASEAITETISETAAPKREVSPRTDITHVLFRQLIIDKNNRLKYNDIEEISESIAENGIIVPLSAYRRKKGEDVYIIKFGHRRYLGVELGIKNGTIDAATFRIPIMIKNPESKEKLILDQLLENDGVPNTMLERALQYQELIELGFDKEYIRRKTRKSMPYIDSCFILLSASEKLRALIVDEVVAATQVVKMLRVNTPDEVEKMILAAIDAKQEILSAKKDTPILELFSDGHELAHQDNVKYTGKSGMDLPSESSKPIKITAKNLPKADKPIKFSETEVKNLIMSALVDLSDWKQYSTSDATTLKGLTDEVDEWFQKSKAKEDAFRYF